MALNTPTNAGHVTFPRSASESVVTPPLASPARVEPRTRRREEQAAREQLKLHRKWLLLAATVLPLIAAIAGFALKRPTISPMPAPLNLEVARGRILAADGTVMAEGRAGARFYPQSSLAAPLIGFTGAVQPDGRYGLEGLEYSFDAALQQGTDIHLSIEPSVQASAERHLREAAMAHGAESGAALVLEVGTGRILAAASYPNYDPNAYQTASRNQMLNRPFQQVYEPGSVIKPLVVAGLLQDGLVNTHELIEAPMTLRVGTQTFRDVARHDPLLQLTDVLAYSSNSAMIHLGSRFTPAQLHDWLARFGVGRDLDLRSAFTRSGLLNRWDRWVPQDQASNSIGQNLSMTPLQLAAAYSIFANDGVYVPPSLVEGEELPAPHRVLSSEVAREVRGMMVQVMATGGLRSVSIPGVSVAGKTGTADVYDSEAGAYLPDDYALTFAGIIPADAPQVVVVVTLMKPEPSSTSTYVAAPIFNAIGTDLVAHWGVAPRTQAWANVP